MTIIGGTVPKDSLHKSESKSQLQLQSRELFLRESAASQASWTGGAKNSIAFSYEFILRSLSHWCTSCLCRKGKDDLYRVTSDSKFRSWKWIENSFWSLAEEGCREDTVQEKEMDINLEAEQWGELILLFCVKNTTRSLQQVLCLTCDVKLDF